MRDVCCASPSLDEACEVVKLLLLRSAELARVAKGVLDLWRGCGLGGEPRFAVALLPEDVPVFAAALGFVPALTPAELKTIAGDFPTTTPEELKMVRAGLGAPENAPGGFFLEKNLVLGTLVSLPGRSRDPWRHSVQLVRPLHACCLGPDPDSSAVSSAGTANDLG